jgi:hypothetical protein
MDCPHVTDCCEGLDRTEPDLDMPGLQGSKKRGHCRFPAGPEPFRSLPPDRGIRAVEVLNQGEDVTGLYQMSDFRGFRSGTGKTGHGRKYTNAPDLIITRYKISILWMISEDKGEIRHF